MDSIHQDAEPENHHDGGTDSLVGEVQPEPSPHTNDKPYDKGHVFQDRVRLAIECMTLLAIAGGVVVACDTLRSIDKSIVEAGRSAAAAEQAANAATIAAGTADEQLKLSREQMTLTQEQMAADREQLTLTREQVEADRDALRLEQRAWLGYDGYLLEARPRGTSAAWEPRELIAGDEFRLRLFVTNNGNTPATNVTFKSRTRFVRRGQIPEEPEWDTIPMTRDGTVFFPRHTGSAQTPDPMMIAGDTFVEYSTGVRDMFIWARLQYCDTSGRIQWSKVGVFRLVNAPPTEFHIWASDVSPDPREINHPDCQK